jgi:hypothetical protein
MRVRQLLDLPLNGLYHGRMAVAQAGNGCAAATIEISFSVCVR